MKTHALMCLAAAALAGCATTTPLPEVVTIQKPVRQAIQAEPVKKPDWAMDSLPIGAPIDDQVKALLAEREQRKAYETELEAAVCRDIDAKSR